jgi:hypothetical protein
METRLLIAGEQVAGEGPGLDVENPYTQTTLRASADPLAEHVHIETKIAAKSWWYPYGAGA